MTTNHEAVLYKELKNEVLFFLHDLKSPLSLLQSLSTSGKTLDQAQVKNLLDDVLVRLKSAIQEKEASLKSDELSSTNKVFNPSNEETNKALMDKGPEKEKNKRNLKVKSLNLEEKSSGYKGECKVYDYTKPKRCPEEDKKIMAELNKDWFLRVKPEKPPNLCLILENAVEEKFKTLLGFYGVYFTCQIQPALYGLRFKFQEEEIHRAIRNLLKNALEATSYLERPQIFYQAELVIKDNKNYLRIMVEDNGHGIPKPILANLGMLGHTHGKRNGTGVGLYLVREFLIKYNGEMQIDTTTSKNTKMILILPLMEKRVII